MTWALALTVVGIVWIASAVQKRSVAEILQGLWTPAADAVPVRRSDLLASVVAAPGSGLSSLSSRPGGGGGSWGGTEAAVNALVAGIPGLTWAGKRTTRSTSSGGVSDHWVGCLQCFALDGSGSVAAMDAGAVEIMRRLGRRYNGRSALVATVTAGGMRFQVLYRTNVGGNHFTHVHVGARVVGYSP